MPRLSVQDFKNFKTQLETIILDPSGLLIASELNFILKQILKDRNFIFNKNLKNIYNEVLIMKEPNNFQTHKLENPENLERLKTLYKKVIEEIDKYLNKNSNY